MKRSRFSEEQIIAILKEQEAGATTAGHPRKSRMTGVKCKSWCKSSAKWQCWTQVAKARRFNIGYRDTGRSYRLASFFPM